MITIVLVEPENPDNIGAVARAMKNMGLRDLRLVKPPSNWKANAKKMAMHGFDLLEKARPFDHLGDAIADCQIVAGTTRRSGSKRQGFFVPYPEAIQKILPYSKNKQTAAVLFGKESKGLDNASFRVCHFLISLPAHSDYPSLNLAQAVMVVAFSLWTAQPQKEEPLARRNFLEQREVVELIDGFAVILEKLNYTPVLRKRIAATFYGLLKRNGILQAEAQMFRGLFRRIRDCNSKERT